MQSLIELIESSVRRYGPRQAYGCMGCSMSFRDLGERSFAFGQWLLSLGLKEDARVAVMLPNVFQQPIAVAGTVRAGKVLVNVNPLYTARELAEQLNDSGAEVLVVLENFAHVVQKAQASYGLPQLRHVLVTQLGDEMGIKGRIVNLMVRHVRRMIPSWQLDTPLDVRRWPQVLAQHSKGLGDPACGLPDAQGRPIVRTPNQLALLQYTGGTTGIAKGAMLTHGNLLANLDQCASWLVPEALERELRERSMAGSGKTTQDKGEAGLTMVAALPMYHIFSFTACMMLGFKFGLKNLLLPNPRDLPSVIDALAREPAHLFPGVNTLFNALLHHPDFSRMNFSELMITVGGGMAVTENVATQWKARTGCVMLEGYGLSETSPVVSATPRSLTEFTGSVGLAMPDTEIVLLDDAGREIAAPVPMTTPASASAGSVLGGSGEIAVRGPQVMQGYWNASRDDPDPFTADGFFKTGDIGAFDDQGFLHIIDRKKDMILVSGFNVYPSEIERVASRHPGVRECAAIGVPDEATGEAVRLFVVAADGRVDASAIMSWCSELLTNYKRPRDVVLVESLPKTNVGKVLRRALRNELQQG